MANVVMTLPTHNSRIPHQGSSFVKPNEIELWNACNMMHGTSDDVSRNSPASAIPNRLRTIVPTQSPVGRWTSPNATPEISTASTTLVRSCRTRNRNPRKKNSSASGASRQTMTAKPPRTSTESSALRSTTMSCSSGWPNASATSAPANQNAA